MFATDEKTEIMERIQAHAQEQGRDVAGGEASFANLYGIFLNNVKRNLHIILCMSPIGNGFRNLDSVERYAINRILGMRRGNPGPTKPLAGVAMIAN